MAEKNAYFWKIDTIAALIVCIMLLFGQNQRNISYRHLVELVRICNPKLQLTTDLNSLDTFIMWRFDNLTMSLSLLSKAVYGSGVLVFEQEKCIILIAKSVKNGFEWHEWVKFSFNKLVNIGPEFKSLNYQWKCIRVFTFSRVVDIWHNLIWSFIYSHHKMFIKYIFILDSEPPVKRMKESNDKDGKSYQIAYVH